MLDSMILKYQIIFKNLKKTVIIHILSTNIHAYMCILIAAVYSSVQKTQRVLG